MVESSILARPNGRLKTDTPPHPRHPIWGPTKLPTWVRGFRGHQWDCAREIVEHYADPEVRLVFLDGPTGAGKTLIAEMVRRLLGDRAVYVCSGKSLQDQFVGDFEYSRVLKGRANYPTLFGGPDVTAADCSSEGPGSMCLTGCHDQMGRCPYNVAKGQAVRSDLAVLNTAYFLAEAQVERTQFGGKKFQLGIFDEADTLEAELMGHVEVAITSRRLAELHVGLPEYLTKPEAWGEWIREKVIPAVKKQVDRYPAKLDSSRSLKDGLRVLRIRRSWERMLGKLYVVAGGVGAGNWVFDDYRNGGAVFKPVRVDGFGQSMLWRHFDRFLLMSATLISADEIADSLGFDGAYRVVKAPMTFPVENRKIYVAPVANMTNRAKEEEWPKAAKAISSIMELHEISDKILVHTVSYKLAEYLMANVPKPYLGPNSVLLKDGAAVVGVDGRRFFTYRSAEERDHALAQFRNTPGAVMFAPSLDRGIDLKDEDCRVCVVAKMAFPNLGDKQISARLHSKGGQLWYAVQTIRSLVQSTGRGVRHADDYCTTYIVDRQFVSNVWKSNKHLLPGWWRESVDMSFNANRLK